MLVVGVALAVVAAQPVRGPWWTYADADAAYSASALSLLDGERTRYLDHPGLPLQELLQAAFGVQWLASGEPRERWIRSTLNDLDRVRYSFRGLAIAFYVLGAALTCLLVGRLAGGPVWGALGGLLWVAAPGLVAMSIQYRPDVLLTTLCLLSAFLVVRGAETRRPELYALAGLAIGFTVTVKLHAVALLVPLAVAYAWRPPRGSLDVRAFARTHRRTLVVLAAVWLALAIALNLGRVPFAPTQAQLSVGLALAAALAASAVLAWRGSAFGLAVFALAGGTAVPVTLAVQDGLQALVSTAKTLTGQNVNEGLSPFANLDRLGHSPLREAVLVFALAVVAALVGLVRREPAPVLLCSGAAALAALSLARLADTHYFAPPFVLSVAAALWLAARLGWPGLAAAVALVLVVAGPRFVDRGFPGHDFEAYRSIAEPGLAAAAQRLRSGEVALTPDYYPQADVRWFGLARPAAPFDDYPYRFLPAGEGALELAESRGLVVAYAVGVPPETLAGLGLRARSVGPDLLALEHDQAAEG